MNLVGLVISAAVVVAVSGQRSPYAPGRTYPGLLPRFQTEELANRNNEEQPTLPPELAGTLEDDDTVRRVSQWPEEKQPYWYKNRKVIHDQISKNVDNGGYHQEESTYAKKEKVPFWKKIFNSGMRTNEKELEATVTHPPPVIRHEGYKQSEQTIRDQGTELGKGKVTFDSGTLYEEHQGKIVHNSGYEGQKLHQGQIIRDSGAFEEQKIHKGQSTYDHGKIHQGEQVIRDQGSLYETQKIHKGQTTIDHGKIHQGQTTYDHGKIHQGEQVIRDQGSAFEHQKIHQGEQIIRDQGSLYENQKIHQGQIIRDQGSLYENQKIHKGQVIRDQGSEGQKHKGVAGHHSTYSHTYQSGYGK